jgi:translation initiation factor IF-2
VAGKIRVHELAKELGLTNKEAVDLCNVLGIGVKTHSSSIEEAQADRVRRKAERDGLKRDQQPEEPIKPAKPGPKPRKGDADEQVVIEAAAPVVETRPAPVVEAPTPAVETAPPVAAPPVAAPPVAARTEPVRTAPEPVRPAAEPVLATPAVAPRPSVAERPAPEPERPTPVRPAASAESGEGDHRVISSTRPTPPPVGRPLPPGMPPRPAGPPAGRPLPPGMPPRPAGPPAGGPPAGGVPQRPAAAAPASPAPPAVRPTPPGMPPRPAGPPPAGPPPAGGRPLSPTGKPIPPPPVSRPLSPSGKPIPPPPGGGRPLSPTGRPIPPPPRGPGGPGARPGGPGGPGRGPGGPRPGGGPGGPGRGPGGPRPGGGPGGPRPGMGARPGGGFGGPRPGGFGGGPGGPRPGGPGGGPGGPGGRPNSQRRAPRRPGRRRRNQEEMTPQMLTSYSARDLPVPEGTIIVERGATAQELAPKLNRQSADVIRFLFSQGEMVTATQSLTDEQIELYAIELGADVLLVDPGQQQEMELQALFDDEDDDDPEHQSGRPPVITVMGHVDHGKTSLLDRIRSANVVAGEAGGITQHIGAYQVLHEGRPITFIDTPGHQAFTKMRARGAQVTDIVVLVVAADDGVMPQTIEAINHAKAAEVPIVVAVNKIDKANADPQRVMSQLAEHELVPESWGGDTIMVEMSALQNLGIDDLLEQLLVVSELEELTANPTGRAKGIVLEANLDVGRGPVATVLIDKGTLKIGDPIVAGQAWGRVRAMIDDKGKQVREAGPSSPVQVLGLSSVPGAGDEFRVAPDERTAKTVGEAREQTNRLKNQRGDARVHKGVRLEAVFDQLQKGELATLNLVLKADVQGSLEALTEALRKLERDDVKLAFVHRGVGGITENDVMLAATTNATIIGFNVRPDRKSRELAEGEGVEVRSYDVIYQILDDIAKAMVGMLAPEFEEVVTGEAEVREIFRVPRIGAIAGCYVRHGAITRGSKVRFLREGTVIWKGAIASLRRFKDDVREVREGFECGIGLTDFQDLKQGDLIETYDERELART